jgi:hypothetical protein
MKKAKDDELRPEYKRSDLGPGVRGKYFRSYQEGTNIVLLRPDVAEVFRDEASVNKALRALIKIAQQSAAPIKRSSRRSGTRAA